jgi:nitrite reductase (NADH) small subunit
MTVTPSPADSIPATCDSQDRQDAPGVAGSPARVVAAWTRVCTVDGLVPGRGVAALVEGQPVAIFWLGGDDVVAVDDVDPFTGVALLSRGLVGDADGEPTVASPLYKQRFALRSGRCLDDEAVALRTWPARLRDSVVEVGGP